MPRLDIRTSTCLPGHFSLVAASGAFEKHPITILDISLSGALVVGFAPNIGTRGELTFKLPEYGRVHITAEAVRYESRGVGFRIYAAASGAWGALWHHIHDRWRDTGTCPYCGKAIPAAGKNCNSCAMPQDIAHPGYPDRHLVRTLGPRIRNCLASPDVNQARRLLQFIESELLVSPREMQEEEFVGTSPCMLEVFSMIKKIAPTDMNVLILGESGTGKELTARAIHERSERRDNPFVAVNCAAIPETLLEAELFGFERGAFTGAFATRKGKFECADGGTLFLDEIGDLSASLQAKLLRFLEDRIVERVGGKEGKKVDVRIVAATNCNLNAMVETQAFRSDLFFRLNAFTITLQPLRHRGEDKVILARFFLERIIRREKCTGKSFSPQAIEAIRHYGWPGNVRELINKIRRGIVMATGETIEPADMELGEMEIATEGNLRHAVTRSQREVVLQALGDNNFIVARAARALGVSRPNMYNLMKKCEIDPGSFKNRQKVC